MSTNLTRAAGVVLVLVGTLMIAAMAEAKEFKGTFTGWDVATEIDTWPVGSPDGERATSGTSKSKGPFGPATSSNLSEIDPEELGSCGPNSVKFRYAAYTSVERYQNGDLIFSGLDPDPDNPSTGCFNIIDGTGTVTMNFVILGGTGRFEGATGWGTATGTGSIPLAWELVPSFRITHSAFWGSAEGEIFLAND